ncbi:hypothetical protein [Clostridium magnum]|nr:hypothetical protein [Clostridium magnum]
MEWSVIQIVVTNQTFINTFNAIIEKAESIKEFDVDLFLKLIEKK